MHWIKSRLFKPRLLAKSGEVAFHLGNSRIVFPLLDPRHDEEAATILRRTFPDREVVGVPAREVLLGGGNIHCITQQVPRG